MTSFTPSEIYASDRPIDPIDERIAQIRHLAIIGIAAIGSNMNMKNLDDAMFSLFEVIARLASEIEDEIDRKPRQMPEAT